MISYRPEHLDREGCVKDEEGVGWVLGLLRKGGKWEQAEGLGGMT